jgi:glycosyltransferase involved in cell wall biosynthesis
MQGLAAGLVVVSTGDGGAAELFEDGYSGLRFEKEDPEGLARTLIGLHEDRDRCVFLAEHGPAAAAAYSDSSLTQRIDEALTEFRTLGDPT